MLLRLALMRRGLALDQCNILDYKIHDLWVEKLFDARSDHTPEGYNRITMQQIGNADKRFFVKLAENTRTGIPTTATGRPLDNFFQTTMNHPDVVHLLQPLPGAVVRTSAGIGSDQA